MANLYTPEQLGIKAPAGGFQEGGWYSGRQYWGGKLSDAGTINPLSNQQGAGQQVSNEVVKQTNPNNVNYIQQQREIQANQINMPISGVAGQSSTPSINTQVDSYRQQLEQSIATRKAEADTKVAELRAKEQEILTTMGELSQPFREELENAERERLYVNQNFEANQSLVNELEQLLTEGNNLIKQQQEVTGLASVRNPRVQKTIMDVQARAGVIEAVINARNGQIAQAQNLIDRSINAIAQDRNDQINYYSTILELNRRDILSLDQESKDMANYQLNLMQQDLDRAEATADYVKQLMLDPATASLMGQAGVSLNDSVETINSKLRQAQYQMEVIDNSNQFMMQGYQPVYDPSSVSKNDLVSFTDSQGKVHYYRKPATPTSLTQQASNWANEMAFGGKATVTNDKGKNVTITSEELDVVRGITESLLSPQFSAKIGTTYTDSYGRRWQYTSKGWIRI